MSEREERHHTGSYSDRQRSGIERYVGPVLQALVLAIMLWIGSSVLDLNRTAIRLEERYTAAAATSTRVENDVAAIRNQLQTMSMAIQSGSLKTENLEQRVKGIELLKDRIR